MTIITDSSELSINLFHCLHNKKTTLFKTKSPTITFGIFKSREFLGVGSISLNSNPQWVSLNQSSNNNYTNNNIQSISLENKLLIENLRIKLKFSKETKSNLIRTPSSFQKEANVVNSSNLNNNSMYSNLKHKKTKSLVPPIKISPLTSTTVNQRHNDSTKNKTINNSNSTTVPNKQLRKKERGVKTVKETKHIFNNNNLTHSQIKQSFNKQKHSINNNDNEQTILNEGNEMLHHSMKILPKTIFNNIDKQELENHIIDQTFEENINHDEIIDNETSNKSIINYLNDNTHPNKIDILFYNEDIQLQKLMKTFSTLNSDFNLLYSNNYLSGVNDNVINFEVELIIEKTLELQNSFYTLIKHYSFTNRKLQKFIMKINTKIKSLLQKQYEFQLNNIDNQYTPINLYANKNKLQIQINDLQMWSNLFLKPKSKMNSTNNVNEKSIRKILLLTTMKCIFKNKQLYNKLSNIEKVSLQKVLGDNDNYSVKQTPRNVNKNRNNDVGGNLDYCSITNVNSPLVDGKLDSIKKKLLPLINENKESGMIRNATAVSFGYKTMKGGNNNKSKSKTQSKSTGMKVKVKKK